MRRRSFLVGAAAAAAAAPAGTLCAPAAQAATHPVPVLALPAPSGHRPVGRTVLHLTDEDRADPWVPTQRRELMVSLWYPAARPSGTPAPYMTAAESVAYVRSIRQGLPPEEGAKLPDGLFATVVTHATVDARPAGARGALPLVLLSPGMGMPRATLTGLAEELAARGYAVAAVGHDHEAAGTSFPDGHTTPCLTCGERDDAKVAAHRAEDFSFVLDELTGPHPAWTRGPRLDADRVALVGHSAGGYSTVPALLRDPRIKAVVTMDGNFRYPNDQSLDRPLLMLGQPSHAPGGPDPTWDRTWQQATGWKRWLTVTDTGHLSFTDVASLGKQVGLPLQRLDGDRADAITRTYVTAFVDTHLRGCAAAPLLDGPAADFPEVRFHRP